MTDKSYMIDILGFHPPQEPTDAEIAIVEDLLQKYGDSLRTFILMKREERAASENDSKKCVLWAKFKCVTHGDGIPWGHAFDKLLKRCDE